MSSHQPDPPPANSPEPSAPARDSKFVNPLEPSTDALDTTPAPDDDAAASGRPDADYPDADAPADGLARADDAQAAVGQIRARRSRRKRWGRRWLVALTLCVALGCIGFLVGRRYVAQQLDIERIAQTQLVPQLEKALGQKVEIGRVETDYRSRVVLHDVVIGRDARSPVGALARAQTVTLDLDLLSLVVGRTDAAGALRRIVLENPQLYVRRDAQGKFNLLSNVKPQAGKIPKLSFTLEAHNGRLWLQDDKTHSPRGVPLILDARGVAVDANVVSSASAPNAPLSFSATSPQVQLPRENQTLNNVGLRGATTFDGKRFEGKINLQNASLPTLLAYLPLKGQVALQSGRVTGTAALSYVSGKLAYRADGQGSGVTGQLAALRDPRDKKPLQFQNAAGRFALDAKNALFNNLTLRVPALKSTLQLDGAVSLNGQQIDVRARCERANTAQLISLLRASAPTARGLGDVTGGPVSADLRIARSGTNLSVSGRASAPNLTWRTVAQDAQHGTKSGTALPPGTLSAPQVSTDFKVLVRPKDTRASGIARFAKVNWNGANAQSAQTSGVIADFRVRTAGNATQWATTLTLPAFAGRANGNSASAQLLNATLRNVGGTTAARFAATGARLQAGTNGTLQADALSGLARVRSTNGGTRIATDLTLGHWNGSAPRLGAVNGTSATLQLGEFEIARPRFAGVLRVTGVDTRGLTALRAATQNGPIRNIGTVDAQLRFANLDVQQPKTAVVRGSFALSRALVRAANQDYEIRAVSGQASYAAGRLRIANARAQSPFGPLAANAELVPGSSIAPRFALTLPQISFSPAQLISVLPAGIQLPEGAIGRVQVTPTGPLTSEMGTPITLRTSFDLTVPRAIVATRESNGRAGEARASNAHLRGNGTLTLGLTQAKGSGTITPTAPRFAGQFAVGAPRLALVALGTQRGVAANAFTVPGALNGTNLVNARAQFGGSFAAGVLRGEGEWTFERGEVPLPMGTARPIIVRITQARGRAQVAPGTVSLPRLSALIEGGHLSGHLALRNGQIEGAVLGQNLNLAQLGQLVGNTSVQSGKGWARVALSGTTAQPRAQVEARGANVIVRAGGRQLPLDFVQADLDLGTNLSVIPVSRLVAWNRGARLEAAGEVRREGTSYVLDMDGHAEGLRVAEALQLAGMQTPTLHDADADGLLAFAGHLSGPLSNSGGTSRLAFKGQVSLRLARAFGLQVPEATSQGELTLTPRGPRVRLTDFAARVSGLEGESRLAGEASLDVPGSAWRVKLDAHDIGTQRIARVASGSLKQVGNRLIPLRGTLEGQAEVRGRLETVGERLTVKPTDGTIKVDSGPLLWREREVGALHADVDLRNGLAQVQEVSFRGSGQNAAYIRLTGVLPLEENAPGLDANLEADGGQASLVLATLREVRDFFGSSEGEADLAGAPDEAPATADTPPTDATADPMVLGKTNPIAGALGRVLDASLALPGLEGRASGQIHFTGTLREPVADVQSLRLVNVSARTPGGGRQPLPSVDLAFLYNTPQRALTIRRADLRLSAPSGDADDDTVLRVQEGGTLVPGGNVSLSARVLNANLSQLAPWVPLLREVDGTPILRGELDQFTIEVGGTTDDPQLSGSIQARSLDFRGYTLDRLRLSNFRIADGELRVRPGDLTIAKGTFQSSVGSGTLPWDWSIPGPDRQRPLQVELPLEKADFGTLLGIISPAVASANAQDFNGFLRVGGTLDAPLLAGRLSLRGGDLKLNPISLPFDAGLKGLSGTVTLTGNTIQIDADDPLKGEIVPVSELDAGQTTTTGNRPAAQRDPDAAVRRAGALEPSVLHAAWEMRGSVQRDPAADFTLRALLANSRYDLALTARNAAYKRTGFGGVRDGIIAAVLRTDEGINAGTNAAQGHQRLTWMITGKGAKPTRNTLDNLSGRQRGDGGQFFSTGAVRLREDFAGGLDALLRSRVEPADEATLRTVSVWNEFPTSERANLQPRVAFTAFYLDGETAGSGYLNGRLSLDNLPAAAPKIPSALRSVALDTPALLPPRRGRETPIAAAIPSGSTPPDPPNLAPDAPAMPPTVTDQAATREAAQAAAENTRQIRLGGTLTFSNAQVFGVPEGASGGAAFELPAGPALDVQLDLGENVSFSTATLRATLGGSLRLTGTPRAPLLVGTLETRSGQARFPGANARLVSGELQVSVFRDPETGAMRARADIDAVARGRAGRYTVEITLRGPLELSERQTTNAQNLSVQITTDPPLSQDEAFAQILGTVPVDQTGDRTTQAYARAVVGLLSAPIFSGIERSLEQVFGLSSISLDYQLDQPVNVEIGKALTDRVYLSYRREITGDHNGEAVPYTLRIEFRIKGNLQLGIQTDERERRQITLQKTFRF